jgi:hypothetical protein
MVAGKQQRDPATGALIYVSTPTITVEFDSFSNWDWGFGNGVLNASNNLANNCWGALTSKDGWLGKKYHMSGCTAEVRVQQPPWLVLINVLLSPWWETLFETFDYIYYLTSLCIPAAIAGNRTTAASTSKWGASLKFSGRLHSPSPSHGTVAAEEWGIVLSHMMLVL